MPLSRITPQWGKSGSFGWHFLEGRMRKISLLLLALIFGGNFEWVLMGARSVPKWRRAFLPLPKHSYFLFSQIELERLFQKPEWQLFSHTKARHMTFQNNWRSCDNKKESGRFKSLESLKGSNEQKFMGYEKVVCLVKARLMPVKRRRKRRKWYACMKKSLRKQKP